MAPRLLRILGLYLMAIHSGCNSLKLECNLSSAPPAAPAFARSLRTLRLAGHPSALKFRGD